MSIVDLQNLPRGYGVVEGVNPVAGLPGHHDFSGLQGDYLEAEHSDALALANGTITLGFTSDQVAGTRTLFSKDASGNGDGGHLTAYIQDGVLRVRLQSDGGETWAKLYDHQIVAGEEHRIAVTFGDAGLMVYLDGKLAAAEPTFKFGLDTNSESLIIGGSGWSRTATNDNVNYPFAGTISNFAIYDQQLPTSQIKILAEAPYATELPIPDLGTPDDDVYAGTRKSDAFDAGAGDDSLKGRAGDDFLFGGDGLDLLNGGSGNDFLNGGADADTIYGSVGDDTIIGGGGDDKLRGGGNDDRMNGGEGNDNVKGDSGDDEIIGGGGNDLINGGSGDDDINGGTGEDTVYGAQGNDRIDGGAGDDVLIGNRGDDLIFGGDGNDAIRGNRDNDTVDGGMGDDDINGNGGGDELQGNYGNDHLKGGAGNDVLDGGHGEDVVDGGAGDDLIISRSDGREPEIANVPGRSQGDPDNEIDPVTGKLYADQPIPADDILIGGAGADTFRFNPLINAKQRFIEKHTADDGTVMWHRVAGENTNLHDHWVDTLGNDVIMDYSKAEGDKIEIIGHTSELYKVEHVDGDGDGLVDHTVLHVRSNQGSGGGAHQYDEIGTITVYGDLVTEADVLVNAAPALGIVDTIDELDEALAPAEIGTDTGPIAAPASSVPAGWGEVGGIAPVSGVPGTTTFSGMRDDHLDLAHTNALALANGTVAMSFVADAINGTRALFSKDAHDYGDGGHLTIYLQDGWLKARLQSDDASSYVKAVDLQIVPGAAHHLAVNFGEAGFKLYVDGKLVAAEPTFKADWSENGESMIVGAAGWSRKEDNDYVNSHFDGTISDVVVYDEALAPNLIATLAEVITGPVVAAGPAGDGDDNIFNGTDAGESYDGGMGDDDINGNGGGDELQGNYGNDHLKGGAGNDVLDGGHGEDVVDGGAGDDLIISRSDGREPEIANVPGRSQGDPDNEIDPVTGKLYADQPIPADDILIGGAGADTFRFNPLINAKQRFIEKHTADDGTVMWHRVAGENTNLHDHWVDTLGNDVIMDYSKAEGDKIEIIGHTSELYKVEHVDGDGDGLVDHTVLHVRSNQGSGGGAHQYDEIGTITVYGDLVTEADVLVNAAPALGIVDTIDELDEALAPAEIGTDTGPIAAPASSVPAGWGEVGGIAPVSGVPGTTTFSGMRDDHLDLAHTNALALANGTVAMSFVADAINGTRALFSKDAHDYGDGGHLTIYLQDGWLKARLQSDDASSYVKAVDLQIVPGAAHHLAVNFGEAGFKLYVDGKLVAAEPTFKADWSENGESMIVGAAGWSRKEDNDYVNSHFDGTISDVVVYDEALAPNLIATLAEVITGPVVAAGPAGDGDDNIFNGTDAGESYDGGMGDDDINGNGGGDELQGNYGNDHLKGGAGNDVLDGGHGEDVVDGGAGDDLIISRSDGREPEIANVPGRSQGDPDNEIDPVTGKLYADQPIPADDILIGGAGADTFRFNPLINAKQRFIEKHTADDGTVMWHRVAGENTNLHDHWVDTLGNDVIMDYSKAEGDKIEIIGHTSELYKVEHVDGDGDGLVDHTVLHVRSNQGSGGGAHQYDEIGTITVYGDLVTEADVLVNAAPALGIVDTIDELDEALAPAEIGTDTGPIAAPASSVPAGWGEVGGIAPVSGVPGTTTFSGMRDDHLDLAHTNALALANGTVAMSFVADAINGTRALFSKDAHDYGDGGHLTIYLQDGWLKARLQSDDASSYVKAVDLQIVPGAAHHLAVNFGEAGFKLYVDGKLVAAEPTFKADWSENGESMIVGAAGWSRKEDNDYVNSHFDGTISDVVVYDEALAPNLIATLAEVITGPVVAAGPAGDGDDNIFNGTDAGESYDGGMGDDDINGNGGGDELQGNYGNDHLKGGAGNDVLDGGHGEDVVDGGAGDDLIISRSDGREPEIANVPGRSQGDPDNEIDPVTGKLYADQPIPADDILIGGAGADTFRFNPLINAKQRFIEKHTADDGTVMWHRVAGENTNLHDHWVDTLGNDVIMDYSKAEGDKIEIIGHTSELYKVEHVDGDGDGLVDHTVLHVRSNQGSGGGAHQYDEIGTITVYGDLVTEADVLVNAAPALGIVDTIDELDEALAPAEIGTDTGPIAAPASSVPAGWGEVGGIAPVSGVPGTTTFSGMRDDHLDLAHTNALALANGTVAMSFVADAINGTRALFSKDAHDYGDGGHLTIYLQDGWLKARLQSDDASSYVKAVDLQIVPGAAHHLAVNFGEAGFKLYVDGKLVAAEPTFKADWSENGESMIVGAAGWSRKEDNDYVNSHFDGTISDVVVYDEALAPNLIATLAEVITGPVVAAGPAGDGDDNIFNGTDAGESYDGGMGDDDINGNGGGDELQGNYGNDHLKGGAGNDVLDGGHGEDVVDGGAGDDLIISRSDGREPEIANVPGRSQGDPDNEIDPVTGKLYADQPIPADDILIGGAGADTFRFNPLINAKQRFIEKHTADDGTVMWHRVAGENTNLHDHWVDTLGNDVIMDYSKAEGDKIEIIGHTSELYKVEHVDGDGDGLVDHTVLHVRSNQGSGGGAHQYDEIGTITVYGDLVTEADVLVNAAPALGIVDTIDELDEALAPAEIGTDTGPIAAPASSVPAGWGEVGGIAPVSGVPGTTTFSGMRDDHLQLAHTDALALANGTVAMSFNVDDAAGTNTLFSKDASGNGDGGHLTAYVGDGWLKVRLQSETESAWISVYEKQIVAGEDYHMAVTFGDTGFKVYLDGDLVGEKSEFTANLADNTESLIIGANGWSRTDENPNNIYGHFDGTISDVAIYGEALNAGQIATLAEGPVTPSPVLVNVAALDAFGTTSSDDDTDDLAGGTGNGDNGDASGVGIIDDGGSDLDSGITTNDIQSDFGLVA